MLTTTTTPRCRLPCNISTWSPPIWPPTLYCWFSSCSSTVSSLHNLLLTSWFRISYKLFAVCNSATQADVDKHLELGKQFLAKGKLQNALTHYHEAVGKCNHFGYECWFSTFTKQFSFTNQSLLLFIPEGDPNNYLTYYKRGTVYLALGKAKNALSDLDRVLELNPDFTPARVTRGNVHLKMGNYDLAQLDFYNVVRVDLFFRWNVGDNAYQEVLSTFYFVYGIKMIFSYLRLSFRCIKTKLKVSLKLQFKFICRSWH